MYQLNNEDSFQKCLIFALLALQSLLTACGSPFQPTPNDYQTTAGSTPSSSGEANSAQAGNAGTIPEMASGGSGVYTSYAGTSSGGANSGGVSLYPSAGTGAGLETGGSSPSQCLAGYEHRECGQSCLGSAYPDCKKVLNCLIEKNVAPPESPLDPCYPDDYIPLAIATKVYQACCQ